MQRPAWMQRAMRQNKAKAEKYLNDPGRLRGLINDVQAKAKQVEEGGGPIGSAMAYITLTTRLLAAYARGEYRSIPWGVLTAIVASLLYFLMPADFIPDFFVGIGLIDDAALLAFVAAQVRTELDRFATWEQGRPIASEGSAAQTVEGAAHGAEAVEDLYISIVDGEASASASSSDVSAIPPDADQVDGARAWSPARRAKPKPPPA